MPKKASKSVNNKITKKLLTTRELEQTSSSTMVLQMASEELSPMATGKRSLRQAVEQVRKQQSQELSSSSTSSNERIGALQEATNLSESQCKRLSKKATEQLRTQEIQDLRLVFDVFDADKSGYIETDELRKALKVLGFKVKKNEVIKMIADIDNDNSGKIDFSEFVEFVISRQGDSRDIYSEIMQGFKLFDHDDSGKINLDNLKWAAKQTGVSLTEQELKDMIYEADKNGDNEIDIDEFMAVMLKTNLFI